MADYHLPKLLNPLINAIFNCPDVDTSPLKKTYTKLKALNDFMVIVPPTYMLLTRYDEVKRATLEERCYNVDFISDHIIIPSNPNMKFRTQPDNLLFHTLSGKDIIIRQRNNSLYTADGFETRQRYNVIKFDTLLSFNDYYKQNESVGYKTFHLIYIDQPLMDGKDISLTNIRDLQCFDETTLMKYNPQTEVKPSQKNRYQQDKNSFQYYLNTKPEQFRKLHNILTEFKETGNRNIETLVFSFNKISADIYNLMKTESIIRDIGNLKKVVREYCESQLYDYVWQVLVPHCKPVTDKNTTSLRALSLDQLDIEFYKQTFRMFRLSDIVILEKNIAQATKVLTKLSTSNTFSQKSRILIETLQLLSKPIKRSVDIEIAINADTLMSLFVLIIIRLGAKNIKCHLYYLQHFCEHENDIKFGLLGYAISTLEAVTVYIDSLINDPIKHDLMKKKEKATIRFIEFITASSNLEKDICISDFSEHFKYRSETGQSILSICIVNFKNNIVIDLLSNKEFEKYFPLDDLLDDETIDGSTLLILALKYSNSEVASILVDILMANCSEYEIISYLKRTNNEGRNAAHFLNDQVELLQKIGKYVEWDARDCNNQTPLFTIFRSYDQRDYDLMVSKSLQLSDHWYRTMKHKALDLGDHVDSKGNTLLHIIKSNVATLLTIVAKIDINKCNKKGLTPLMVFVKYNRLQNIETILKDSRILFSKTKDHNGLDCFDYAQDERIIELLGKHALENKTVFHHIFAHSLKFHQNTSYSLKVSVRISGTDSSYTYKTFSLNLKTIRNLFKVILKTYPLTFLPLNDILSKLDDMASIFQQRNLKSIRLKDKEVILSWLTQCLDTLVQMKILPISDILNDSISLIEWIQERKLELKDTEKKNKISYQRDFLEPEQVNIIQNFLKFNLDELNSITLKLAAMKKLAIFLKLKKMDISDSKELLRILSHDFNKKSISKILMRYSEIKITPYSRDSIDLLLQSLQFIEACIVGLSRNIIQLLNINIPAWWKLYGELLELNRYDNQANATNFTEDVHLNNIGGNIITNFIDNKKLKNERQLYEHKLEIKTLLQSESLDINYKHEQLAEELSKFVLFKSEYFTLGLVKMWSKQNIRSLNQISLNLEGKLVKYQNDSVAI